MRGHPPGKVSQKKAREHTRADTDARAAAEIFKSLQVHYPVYIYISII